MTWHLYSTPSANDEPGVERIDDLGEFRRARYAMVDLMKEEQEAYRYELPGAEASDEELAVAVVPMQADEFRCVRCFLIRHRSQLVRIADGSAVCDDCAT